MNNSTEPDHPYQGQKFKSFDALKKYLEEYGQKNYVNFWIRSSHTRKYIKSKISKIMNPDLKYVCVKFACIFGGEKIRYRGSGIRKSSTYRNLGCPCMINAVVGEDGNHVKLDTVILEHNHVLCKTLYDSLKKTKRKSQTIKRVKEFLENGVVEEQELDLLGENTNHSNGIEESGSQNQRDFLINEVLRSDDPKYESEDDVVGLNSTQVCLKNLRDEYGQNVKILIVNTNNTGDQVTHKTYLKVNEEMLELCEKEDESKDLPNSYSKVCRLCLSSKDKLSPIFDPNLPLKSTLLSFKIMGCASIEIASDDGLPNNICTTCEANLDVAYNFRIRCENSDSILRNAFYKKEFKERDFIDKIESEKLDNEIINEEETSQETLIIYPESGKEDEGEKEKSEPVEEPETVGESSYKNEVYVQFPITCPMCASNFDTYEAMLEHLDGHTDDETLLLSCNICTVIFPTMKELQTHMREHLNETSVKSYLCSLCNMTFDTAKLLKIHKKSHVGTPTTKKSDVNYLCNVCGKILKTKYRFQSHKNAHEGLRPHVCLKCGKGFADRKNMHQHYDVVHLRKAKHECPVCQKKFYTRTKMKSHITMHYDVKPFACDMCSRTFRLKMNMIKHKKTHSKERPHQCDKCNAAFIDKNMLKRHSYIHGGLRPYPCPVCGHRFSVKFHLKKHLEKSKCGETKVVAETTENYDWMALAQPETNLTQNQCVVLYQTNDNTVLQGGGETISMNILQEYNESPS